MSDLYEIAELDDGEIVLQRADEKGEPLVRIKFSEESLFFLNDAKYDVAKAMIEAGLDAAHDLNGELEEADSGDTPSILH
ncbi:hypothetical protein SAMN02745866_02047 [Alteromonadaceae bacterium Bs31]|nr:hypothetical protein SAMN02745866_02047 [Alteromonadaceae bacterium Bs31]